MIKFNRYCISNAMLFANLLAVWGSSLISYYLKEEISHSDQQIIERAWEYGQFLDLVYFIVIGISTIWYELPIRRVLRMMRANIAVDPDLALKARQRLLNEPYIIAALDFIIWIFAGLAMVVFLTCAGVEPLAMYLEGLDMLLTAFITITVVFFFLQFILQIWLAPIFFPDGQLSAVPGTRKTQIKKTLLSLAFALNFIPLSIIIFAHVQYIFKLHGNFAQNAEGKMFGKEPIYTMIRQNAAESSNQILKCIVDELNRFQKGHGSSDDVTLVVIKIQN